MVLLSAIFLILVLLSLFDVIEADLSSRIIAFVLTGLVLIFVASLRYGDRDYRNYEDVYANLTPLFEQGKGIDLHVEPGYALLNRICKTIHVGTIGVFFIMALSSVSLTLNFFRKHTDFFFIALIIYFSHVFLQRDMLQIRSGLAASIALYSLPYVSKRKFIPFLLILLLSMSFHAGSAIVLIVYFIFPLLQKNSKREIYLVSSGFFIGVLLTAPMLDYFFTTVFYIPGVSLYTKDPDNFKALGLLNPVLLKSTLLFIILYHYREELRQKVKYFDVFVVSLSFSIFWLAAFNQFAILAARLATYLSNTEHLLIPALFYTRMNKLLLWVIVICYCLFMFSAKFEIFEDLSFYFFN